MKEITNVIIHQEYIVMANGMTYIYDIPYQLGHRPKFPKVEGKIITGERTLIAHLNSDEDLLSPVFSSYDSMDDIKFDLPYKHYIIKGIVPFHQNDKVFQATVDDIVEIDFDPDSGKLELLKDDVSIALKIISEQYKEPE